MCPALLYYLAQTWAADRHRQTQHDNRPGPRAGPAAPRPSCAAHRLRGLPAFVARCMLTTLGGGSP